MYVCMYLVSKKRSHGFPRVSQPGAKNEETLRKPSENVPGNPWETVGNPRSIKETLGEPVGNV